MIGYIFRFIVLFFCVVAMFISLKNISKHPRKSKRILCFSLALIIFVGSFISIDIKEPTIKDINKGMKIICDKFVVEDEMCDSYYVYTYDNTGYYGTIAISVEDEEYKNDEIHNKPLSKITDDETICLYSKIACVRDKFGLPNQSIGMLIIYQDNVRVAIKYTYKDKKFFGPLKYLIFTQYFSRDDVSIKRIVESIDTESLFITKG